MARKYQKGATKNFVFSIKNTKLIALWCSFIINLLYLFGKGRKPFFLNFSLGRFSKEIFSFYLILEFIYSKIFLWSCKLRKPRLSSWRVPLRVFLKSAVIVIFLFKTLLVYFMILVYVLNHLKPILQNGITCRKEYEKR